MSGGGRRSRKKSSKGPIFWNMRDLPPRESTATALTRRSTRDETQEYEERRASELTERELRLGKATWAKYVDARPVEFRELVFAELFRRHPEYQFYFMRMMDNDGRGSSVFSNPTNRPHMYDRLVPKMRELFESLDEPAVLHDIMTKLGLYHAKLRLDRRHMTDMIKVFIACVDKMSGYKLQKDEEYALDKCLYTAFTIAIDAMEQWTSKHPPQLESSMGKASVNPRGTLRRVDSRIG